jgi:hypothetical protein
LTHPLCPAPRLYFPGRSAASCRRRVTSALNIVGGISILARPQYHSVQRCQLPGIQSDGCNQVPRLCHNRPHILWTVTCVFIVIFTSRRGRTPGWK